MGRHQPIHAHPPPRQSGVVDTKSDCAKVMPSPFPKRLCLSVGRGPVRTSIKGRPWTRLDSFPFSFLSIRLLPLPTNASYQKLFALANRRHFYPKPCIHLCLHLAGDQSHHTLLISLAHYITLSSFSFELFLKPSFHNGSLYNRLLPNQLP